MRSSAFADVIGRDFYSGWRLRGRTKQFGISLLNMGVSRRRVCPHDNPNSRSPVYELHICANNTITWCFEDGSTNSDWLCAEHRAMSAQPPTNQLSILLISEYIASASDRSTSVRQAPQPQPFNFPRNLPSVCIDRSTRTITIIRPY